jgi:hypothetical protein
VFLASASVSALLVGSTRCVFALHSDAQDTLGGATLQYDLGVGDVRSTMESLGVYLFAGAFRFLASASVGLPCTTSLMSH